MEDDILLHLKGSCAHIESTCMTNDHSGYNVVEAQLPHTSREHCSWFFYTYKGNKWKIFMFTSILLCLHFSKGSIMEDGVVAKCKVYIIKCALVNTQGGHFGNNQSDNIFFQLGPNSIYQRLCHISSMSSVLICNNSITVQHKCQ